MNHLKILALTRLCKHDMQQGGPWPGGNLWKFSRHFQRNCSTIQTIFGQKFPRRKFENHKKRRKLWNFRSSGDSAVDCRLKPLWHCDSRVTNELWNFNTCSKMGGQLAHLLNSVPKTYMNFPEYLWKILKISFSELVKISINSRPPWYAEIILRGGDYGVDWGRDTHPKFEVGNSGGFIHSCQCSYYISTNSVILGTIIATNYQQLLLVLVDRKNSNNVYISRVYLTSVYLGSLEEEDRKWSNIFKLHYD